MKKVVLDFNGLDSKEEIQEYLAGKMKFPFYYGRNLDALYDCLTDISEPTAIALNISETWEANRPECYLDKLYRTFKDAEQDNRNLAVFFGKIVDWQVK